METIVERPAGLDVHKAQVTACVRSPAADGGREEHFAEFATTVSGLLTLRDWLAAHLVTQVTMEATGVYWSGRSSRTSSSACSSTPATSSRSRGSNSSSPVVIGEGRMSCSPATQNLRSSR